MKNVYGLYLFSIVSYMFYTDCKAKDLDLKNPFYFSPSLNQVVIEEATQECSEGELF